MKTLRIEITFLAFAYVFSAQLVATDLGLEVVNRFQFTNSSIQALAVSGDHVFADEWLWQHSSKEQRRIAIFNVRDPANPQRIESYEVAPWASEVAFAGKYAFVLAEGFSIVDLSNPAEPREVAQYPTEGYQAAISGDYAYILTRSGLAAIDISNHENLTSVSSRNFLSGSPVALAVSGSFAFVVERRFEGTLKGYLHVIDISDPANLRQLGSYAADGAFNNGTIAVSGKVVFLVEENHLVAINFTDPLNPKRIGAFGLGFDSTSNPQFALAGDRLYVAGRWRGLQVIDISDPANLRFVGGLAPNGIAACQDVALSGDLAFTAHGEHGLGVINVENPANLTWIGGYYDGWTPRDFNGYVGPGRSSGLFLSESRAYVVSEDAGVHVFDISAPEKPVRIRAWKPHTWSTNFAFSVNHAFIADPATGIDVFDLSNPARPRLVSMLNTVMNPQSIAASAKNLFVADGTNGLVIFDISNPAVPRVVGTDRSAGSAYAVSVSGNYAGVFYDQTREGGSTELVIIDIRDPANPSYVLGMQDPLGTAIAATGESVYWYQRDNSENPLIARYNPGFLRMPPYVSSTQICPKLSIGEIPLPTGFDKAPIRFGLTASGTHVIGFQSERLFVLDEGIRNQLECVGSRFPNEIISSLATSGNYVYFVEGATFKVVKLVPANPQRRGFDFTIPNADRVQVAAGHGYVKHADGRGLSIIDLSSPVSPKRLGSYISTNLLIDFAIEGALGFALEYVGDDSPGILRILDFSDPADTSIKASHETETPVNLTGPRLFGKLATSENRVFVLHHNFVPNSSERSQGGVEILDVKNPESPVRLGRYLVTPRPGFSVPTVAVTFEVRGDLLYLIRAGGFRGAAVPECCVFGLQLEIVSIENPATPVALSSHGVGRGFATSTHQVRASLALSETHGFVLDPEGELTVFDIADPNQPRPVASYQFDFPRGGSSGLTLSGSRLYVNSSTSLEILDITNPANPKRIGGNSNLDLPVSPDTPFSFAVANGFIYAPAASLGLLILNDYQWARFEQIVRETSGTIRLRVSGPPGVPGLVQIGNDLRSWVEWTPLTFAESALEIVDSDGFSARTRFYRVVTP